MKSFIYPPAIGFEKIFAKDIINLYDFMAKKAVSKTIACSCRQSTEQTPLTTTAAEKKPFNNSTLQHFSLDYPNLYFKITLPEGAVVSPTEIGATCKYHLLDENSKQNKF